MDYAILVGGNDFDRKLSESRCICALIRVNSRLIITLHYGTILFLFPPL